MGAGSRDDDFNTRSDRPSRASDAKLEGEPDFGPRYKVLAKLGEGGMGEVFRAYDAELRGEVALKIVRADRSDEGASLARFRREIALARKVTSPNVLRVYDLMEHAGLRFLTMEFVEGEDLAAVMRNGRMPLERALLIFRQVCVGLVAAHEEGVVHRDLKPQNVLVDREDRVHVADFGLARSIGDEGMTVSGAVLGSPAYMSPEQVKGQAVDERSDIYSLGIMLYQLVCGETPFKGPNAHTVMEMRLHRPPRPLHELEPLTPRHIDSVAARCLAVNPAARYPSVHALLAELDAPAAAPRSRRWLVPVVGGGIVLVGAAVALILIVGGRGAGSAPSQTASGRGDASLATPAYSATADAPLVQVLLPAVENRTGDPLFDGVIDDALSVTLRQSTRVDPTSALSIQALATELSPGAPVDDALGRKLAERDHCRVVLVRGALASKGSGYTIELRAHDTADGRELLRAEIEAPSSGQFISIAVRWARQLRGALGEQVPPDGKEPLGISESVEAVHEDWIGGELIDAANAEAAIPHFTRAVALDPKFAEAYEDLAVADFTTSRFVEAAEQQRHALELSDRMGERERLYFLGLYNYVTSGENDQAIASFDELLRKWPRDLSAEIGLANVYTGMHQTEKALAEGRIAVHDHPHDLASQYNLAGYLIVAGDLSAATHDLDEMFRQFPRVLPYSYMYRAIIAALEGRHADVLAAYDKLAADDPASAEQYRADFALSESRLADATVVLERGVAKALAAGEADNAESKLALLAETRLRRGDKRGALAAAARVTKAVTRQFFAAIVELQAGDAKAAAATATRLAREAPPLPRALAKLLTAEAARLAGRPADAIAAITSALTLSDTWYGHFLLARAHFDARQYAEAEAELEICRKRRGEGAIVFLDDIPSLRLLPPVTYWLARTQEALGKPEAQMTLAEFLSTQTTADHDSLVVSAQKRMHK